MDMIPDAKTAQTEEVIDRYTRSRMLFGDAFATLQTKKVLILGVGGVGGFALDCLYRSGISNITIVDSDCFEITNQNRQIGAECLNEPKVSVLAQKYPGITAIQERVDAAFLERFNIMEFDYILDAIDDIDAKVEIAKIASKKPFGYFISSTGSAKKLNPMQIRVVSIKNTYGDRFARRFREHLRKAGVNGDFKAVFSPEAPKCKNLGSCSAVTASFGLVMASQIIYQILKEVENAR